MSIDDLMCDDGFKDFLQQVVDLGGLDDTAIGITKLVMDKGVECLSAKQKHVFETYVLDPFTVSSCQRCGSEIPWSEMYDAATEHGLCNYCWHMSQKQD